MVNQLILFLTGALLTVTVMASDLLSPLVLNQQTFDPYASWNFTLSESDKPWFAYYGVDNSLYVRRPDGSEIGLGATGRPRQQSGLAMIPSGDNSLSILWRDKLPQKNLYLIHKLGLQGDVPSPIVVGGEESEPLPALKMANAGKGDQYLLLLGEKGEGDLKAGRDEPNREDYHIYFRTIEADGKTLSPVVQVMPGLYPAWIVDEKVIPVFSWMTYEGQLAMTMRVFDRANKSFGPVIKIADAPPISALFEAFKSGNRWFLLWLGKYGEQQQMLLEGQYSDDQGQTWKRFAIEDLRGLNIGGVKIATDQNQHILITLDGNWRFTDPEDTKNNVYVIRSNDNGTTWQKSQTLRPKELKLTKAQYPVLALGTQPGTVMLAWEDWRDIRPNIYISYSQNFGETWEPALPLGRPGVWNLGLDPLAKVLLVGQDNRFRLVARQYNDDSLKDQQNYVLYTFTWDDVKRNEATFRTSETRAKATEARLHERISTYWQAMQDKQYETAYALMDPFFRNKRDLKTYLSDKGRVLYHRYQIGTVTQQGNIAKAMVEIDASVPEFKAPSGKIISQPLKTIPLVQTWLFVNEDWYLEYYDSVAEAALTRY